MLGRLLLQSEELFRAEAFVVDLRRRFDEILEMGAGEEVAEVDEFAVAFVFYVDGSPAVLTAADGFAVHGDVVFASYYCEGDD